MSSEYECTTGDIQVKLTYALPNPYAEKHRARIIHTDPTILSSNYVPDLHSVKIQDLRGQEKKFSLDANGFEYVVHKTTQDFKNNSSIKSSYYEEMRQLVKDHTGAHQVFVVAHYLREGHDDDHPSSSHVLRGAEPAFIVHTDRTPQSVIREVKTYLGEASDRLLQGRVRYINAWRPIGEVVHHEPLAVSDWQTFDALKLFPLTIERGVSVETPLKEIDIFLSRFSAGHSWYFLKHQDPSEVLMMKFYDSDVGGSANLCLHTSFRDPGCHVNAPRRRSIEVGMLVFG